MHLAAPKTNCEGRALHRAPRSRKPVGSLAPASRLLWTPFRQLLVAPLQRSVAPEAPAPRPTESLPPRGPSPAPPGRDGLRSPRGAALPPVTCQDERPHLDGERRGGRAQAAGAAEPWPRRACSGSRSLRSSSGSSLPAGPAAPPAPPAPPARARPAGTW